MQGEFISGYVALAEGEKDPQNLLSAFAIARVILIEFDIDNHAEVGPFFSAVDLNGSSVTPHTQTGSV
jgi:hypothetical protein